MATLKLEIVTPEGVTYSEDVDMVTLPADDPAETAALAWKFPTRNTTHATSLRACCPPIR